LKISLDSVWCVCGLMLFYIFTNYNHHSNQLTYRAR